MRILSAYFFAIIFSFSQISAEEISFDFLNPFKKPLWSLGYVPETENSSKTILYLNDAPNSAWFYLGAFYAFENYGVKIDSIVGNSVGLWIASLWKSGWALDDIQRLLRENDISKQLSLSESTKNPWEHFKVPLSKESWAPSLQMRLAFSVDSNISVNTLPLTPDSIYLANLRFRFRVEESLFRKKFPKNITGVNCEGHYLNGSDAVIKTMPFAENISGTGCVLPLPLESKPNEFPIILSAWPKRISTKQNSESYREYLYYERELSFLNSSILTIRPHFLPENSPENWMQSGFSEVEKNLSAFASIQKLKPYETSSKSIASWFRVIPVVDSVPSEIQPHLLSFWNYQDSGFSLVNNFISDVSQSPVYDSLKIQMHKNGTLQIEAKSPFVLDLQAGGFGSSVFGPFLFGDFRIRYVNQFEYELGSNIFYGLQGFGVTPEFKLLRLLEGSFDFGIRYNYRNLKPLNSFINDIEHSQQIKEEWQNDVSFILDYHLNKYNYFSLQALVGKREYLLNEYISKKRISVRPISPELSFIHNAGQQNPWFAKNGSFVKTTLGLESVGAVFGEGETVPIFWKLNGNTSLAYSPYSFLTFGLGALAGANIYQEDGETYPPSFGFLGIDNTIRQEINATPFASNWYSPEYRSHHYLAINARLGLHLGNFSAWLFASYIHDFEENELLLLDNSRLALEPVLRYAYRSLEVSIGMTRLVDFDSASDLSDFSDYRYFIQVGNFCF